VLSPLLPISSLEVHNSTKMRTVETVYVFKSVIVVAENDLLRVDQAYSAFLGSPKSENEDNKAVEKVR